VYRVLSLPRVAAEDAQDCLAPFSSLGPFFLLLHS
jgi:hypothetical protein